jgi:mannose-1-phosphate guanylyltransferase
MTDANAYAVIMAGGSGTRFWPASRSARPKQFLTLGGGTESLIQATVRRAGSVCSIERVLVVTGAGHADTTRAQLPSLPPANLLLEPIGRNTAPCIAWSALVAKERDPNAVLAVLPADSFVRDEAAFTRTLERAIACAKGGRLVTIGIVPTRPETGYGYVEVGDKVAEGVHSVSAFVEKPDAARAESYLASGRHLWNSGMFFFRAADILAAIGRHLPELAELSRAYEQAQSSAREQLIAARFPSLPAISIDYGVMERERELAVVPGDFGWDDVGSWSAAFELAARDQDNHAHQGTLVSEDAGGCYVSASPDKLIALLGVRDLVIVDTEDALLVMPKERAQDVRRIVEQLQAKGLKRHL